MDSHPNAQNPASGPSKIDPGYQNAPGGGPLVLVQWALTLFSSETCVFCDVRMFTKTVFPSWGHSEPDSTPTSPSQNQVVLARFQGSESGGCEVQWEMKQAV